MPGVKTGPGPGEGGGAGQNKGESRAPTPTPREVDHLPMGPWETVYWRGEAFPLMGALLWPHVATLARLPEGARSHPPECRVSARPTLRRGRRFHSATRMPTPSSGLGSSSRSAWVQQMQWPGLCPDGWDSPHPSSSCSSTASHARPSAGKGWTRQGGHQVSQEGQGILLSSCAA